MNRLACVVLATLVSLPAWAQSRSDWEMHDGLEVTAANPYGLLAFQCSPSRHGDACEYSVATIPGSSDAGWRGAPNPDTIGFSIPSRVCYAPSRCWAYGDFTYFQTFVTVPENVVVDTFSISFSGMDDGSRITLFNSLYPQGLVIPGSYVYLGGSGTSDLAEYVVSGEVNRVVVTQVDDCCSANNLRVANIVLNGQVVVTNTPPEAVCQDWTVAADADCLADVDVDAGSFDADGDPISVSVDPESPYGLGESEVLLEVCDESDACDTCEAVVTVVDEQPPTITCGDYDITNRDVPASFTATADDNCSVSISLDDVTCTAINGSGRLVERDCDVDIDGDTLTVLETGGNGTTIGWTATATDGSGNVVTAECSSTVTNPGGGSGCNQGIGNGDEGCDPGNSNQGDPSNSNDEPGGNGRGKANGRR